jgi:hypothetical protein
MELVSGIRPARRWRILLAHDASASTCDAMAAAIEGALKSVDLSDASSVDDARVALQGGVFHVCMVCLDLPPAPLAGVRLAQEVLAEGVPVVLITRSLRWIPPNAAELCNLPWVSPDARPAEVAKAISLAISTRTGAEGDFGEDIGGLSPSLASPAWIEGESRAVHVRELPLRPRPTGW